jgi:hypothetical protein
VPVGHGFERLLVTQKNEMLAAGEIEEEELHTTYIVL